MSLGLVLVIDDDEWVGRLLAVALRESGYEVTICGSAVEGFEKAVEVQPDCIICDVDLPDVDGFWVARKIRMASSRVSVTPFLFLSGLDDRDTRIQGFHVGADVYMTKPFRIDEVVAQVGALVQMASRLRQNRNSFLSLPPTDAAMVGDLAQMSIATVLTLLDMERRSGKLEVSNKEQRAILGIVSGAITSADLGGEKRDPLKLLRTLLTWDSGRFAFRPDDAQGAPRNDNSINALLMEAVRLEDETRASLLDPGELAPSSSPGLDRRPRMPKISMPPASEPSESGRISAALASAFGSSFPPGIVAKEDVAPPALPPATNVRPPLTVPSSAGATAAKPASGAPIKGPSAQSNPAIPAGLKRPATVGATSPSSPATPPPGAASAPAGALKSAATSEALKPRPATAPRVMTPGPIAAAKPPPDPPRPPPLPMMPDEEEVSWSEPPPPPAPEADPPALDEEPMGEKLRPPPPPTGPRPAAPRGTPARTLPVPNPRMGQGSGEK